MIFIVFSIVFGAESVDKAVFSSENLSEMVLVTAFFDVGRANYELYPRSQGKYISCFKRWARIKNHLVVFCQGQEIEKKIMDIRKDYNLEERTKIVIIDDIYSVEREIYDKMVEIANSTDFLNFRVGRKDWPENKAEYNYVTNLKTYFLQRAVLECEVRTDTVAWIDFGWDRDGYLYTFEEDYGFLLACPPSNKITLFVLESDGRPMFEIVRTVHPDAITSGFFICPTKLVDVFWKEVRKCMFNLLNVGLMDDDQPLLLFASEMRPELFEFKRSDWYLPLQQHCNGKHMRMKEKKKRGDHKKKTTEKIQKHLLMKQKRWGKGKKKKGREKAYEVN